MSLYDGPPPRGDRTATVAALAFLLALYAVLAYFGGGIP